MARSVLAQPNPNHAFWTAVTKYQPVGLWSVAARPRGTAGGAVPEMSHRTKNRAWVYRAVAALLIALATLTALTGARTAVIWFKICPVLLTAAATLLAIASF